MATSKESWLFQLTHLNSCNGFLGGGRCNISVRKRTDSFFFNMKNGATPLKIYGPDWLCVGDPQHHCQALWFTRRTHRTGHIAVFMAMIYCRGRIQSKEWREKACGAKATGNRKQVSKSPLARESHRMHLVPPATDWDNICETPSKRSSVSRVFIVGWLYRHSAQCIPESQAPGGKAGVLHKPYWFQI